MVFRIREWMARRGRMGGLVRCGLLVFFLWLAGRFWDPYHGFTKLLQVDAKSASYILPVLRSGPIYVYRDSGGYDGQFYAQLATSPALRDPGLPTAIDNLGYRARRMLLCWVAWAAGGGDPVSAVRVYAGLNVVLWLGLAALLWRIFPVGEWRATVAWAGLLFAAGTLHSVRYALTDLAALLLLAGALWQLERGRLKSGMASLSLAVLARETSVLSAVAFLPGAGASRKEWVRAMARGVVAILPLVAWLVYLHFSVGRPDPGLRNFAWPLTGLANKWCETWVSLEVEPNKWLSVSTLLVQLALTVQLLYLVIRPQWSNQWWRVAGVYGVLLLCLGPAVWEGFPGAATRVLLPLALAFNVLAVRARAGALWLILGNLTVLNGIYSLWLVPDNYGELNTRWTWSHSYLLETDRRWYTTEFKVGTRWAWCQQDGRLTLRSWPRRERVRLQLRLQGVTPRGLEIRHNGQVVWQGRLENKLQWIQLPELSVPKGDLVLELHSDTPPQHEGNMPYARELGFVCYGFKVD